VAILVVVIDLVPVACPQPASRLDPHEGGQIEIHSLQILGVFEHHVLELDILE